MNVLPEDLIDLALKHGASFTEHPPDEFGNTWTATANYPRKVGRGAAPMVSLRAKTKAEAARMYLDYFHKGKQ